MESSSTSSVKTLPTRFLLRAAVLSYIEGRRPDLLTKHHIQVALGKTVPSGLDYTWNLMSWGKRKIVGKPYLLVGVPQLPPDFHWNKYLFGVPVLYIVPNSVGYNVKTPHVVVGQRTVPNWLDQYVVYIPRINVPDETGWGPPSASWLFRPMVERWSGQASEAVGSIWQTTHGRR